MNSTLSSRTILARRVAAVCGAGVLLVGAAACGSSSPTAAANGASNDSGGTNQSTNGNGQQGQRPGANGKVAAVSGSTAQVQSQGSGQVAVSWTASTTFTKEVSAKLADVGVGDCVMVTPVADASTGSAPTAQPTTQPTAVTAGTVRITAKVAGSCSPARGGGPGSGTTGGGPQFQGNPEQGTPPSGAPAGSDGSRPQLRGFGGAFGTVKSVSATGFVVTATTPSADDPTKTVTSEITVTVAKATTYSTTAKGAASDVKVGSCVNASGATDNTGAVTATTIAVTPAVDGECTGGLVRFSRDAAGTGPKTQAS